MTTQQMFHRLFLDLHVDEAGFIVSAELVLVATIAVLSLVVGLTEVAYGVNEELEDVGSAFGAVNQTYKYHGLAGCKGESSGSCFGDEVDHCDGQFDIVCDTPITGESYSWGYGYGY